MISLSQAMREALLAQAQAALPLECVGLIVGKSWQTARLQPLPNVAEHPERAYLAEPSALLAALKALDADDEVLLAIYHSHPSGPAMPSATDLSEARYEVPHLIVAPATGTIRAFELTPDGYREISITWR